MSKRVLILGAYGGVGRAISKAMLQHTDVQLTVAGRKRKKLDMWAHELHVLFPKKVINSLKLDAKNLEGLKIAMKDIDLAVVAVNNPKLMDNIARAAIDSETDLVDCFVGSEVILKLQKFEKEVIKKHRVFITQAGFHPGLPTPFIRYGSQFFDEYDTANVASAMHTHFENPEAAREIFDEMGHPKESILKEGQWNKGRYKDIQKIHFSHDFGDKSCYPLPMAETYALDEELGIKNLGVYAAGFNFFVDNFVFPLSLMLQKINHEWGIKVGSKLMYRSLKKHYDNDGAVEFRLEADGTKDNHHRHLSLTAYHGDAYEFTALSVVACLFQYFDCTIHEPGIYLMGLAVDENRIIKDLKDLGVEFDEKITED